MCRARVILWLALASSLAGGCAVRREAFPGTEPSVLWGAMVTAARAPVYDDPKPGRRWNLRENDVYVDAAGRRLEIYRQITRFSRLTSVRPQREQRTFRLQIRLEPGEPPVVVFRSRGAGLPMPAEREADRFFHDVHALVDPEPSGGEP